MQPTGASAKSWTNTAGLKPARGPHPERGCNTKANILHEYKVINNFYQFFKLFGIYTNK
jgi:hypothetical protein